jgi:outer membrane protein TolC
MNVPAEEWDTPLVPTQALSFFEIEENVSELYARALRQRPEAKLAQLDIRRAKLEEAIAENDRLPGLDVGASYGLIGQDDSYRRALDQLATFTGWSWSVFVNFEWAPLGMQARAEQARAEVLHSRASIQQQRLALDIRIQVRQAVRAARTAARQVHAAAKTRRLAERSLDAEQRRFINGLSSNFVIAQRQEELSQARLAEVSALVDHAKSLVELRRATGELLSSRGVDLRINGR